MGNKDGLTEAIILTGTNRVEEFNGGYFSFAFGNEIALVINGSFYILNCGEELWEKVKNEIIKTKKDKNKLIDFWLLQSKIYEVNEWSENMEDLKDEA